MLKKVEKVINDWYIETREKKTYVDLSDVSLLKQKLSEEFGGEDEK